MRKRNRKIIVEADLPIDEVTWYVVAVLDVTVERRLKLLDLLLRHTNGDHEGRVHQVSIRLPIRPGGLAVELCRACALEPRANEELDLGDAIGKTIAVRFRDCKAGRPEAISFRPHNGKSSHE